jgi:hypothetical protein
MQLVVFTGFDESSVRIKCDRCDRFHYKDLQRGYEYLESKVKREIERNIRTGDWKHKTQN